jgi:hypothetical protein
MKIKEIVYLSIYSVYLDIYDWPKVYIRIYGDMLLANRICHRDRDWHGHGRDIPSLAAKWGVHTYVQYD